MSRSKYAIGQMAPVFLTVGLVGCYGSQEQHSSSSSNMENTAQVDENTAQDDWSAVDDVNIVWRGTDDRIGEEFFDKEKLLEHLRTLTWREPAADWELHPPPGASNWRLEAISGGKTLFEVDIYSPMARLFYNRVNGRFLHDDYWITFMQELVDNGHPLSEKLLRYTDKLSK
jgi:hypothetical protein